MNIYECISEVIATPIKMILFAGWLFLVSFALRLVWNRFLRIYKFHWYDKSRNGPNEDMTWCEIRSLIKTDSLDPKASNLTCKAIVKKFLPERYPCKYLTFDILCASSLVLLVCGSFRLIFASKYSCDQCTSLLGTVETVAKEAPLASAIVTGGLALVGVVFTIIYQTRLTARSQNRQHWIHLIAEQMNILMSNIPSYSASDPEISKAQLKFRTNISKLDLYLNPSEHVHRSFMAIVRFMFRIEGLEVDKEAHCRLFNDGVQSERMSKEMWVEWNSKAMKLGNILLKREWEQVKHVR